MDQNIRLEAGIPSVGGISVSYNEWVIDIGDGNVESISMDGTWEKNIIEIPQELHVDAGVDGKKAIINTIYSELHTMRSQLL